MTHPERIRRRELPHWDVPHAAYFVTSCLEGSIPAQGWLDLERYRADLRRRPRPVEKSESEWATDCWKRAFVRAETWLDNQPAVRHFADARLAQLVVDALYFFAGQRYDLLAFVVMPSHLHWVFQPIETWVNQVGLNDPEWTPREQIVHSVNRFTARECNKLLGVSGAFWQHEPYDHWIRDAEELERITRHVLEREMTRDGNHILRHLLIHEPIEVGRPLVPEIPQDRAYGQIAIAMQHSLVQHREDRGAVLRTYWIINPQFRPVLEELLFQR